MSNRNIIIRTEKLSAGFGDRVLFSDLDLEIREGDFTLIRGENGSGKTTLVKILLGLQKPRAGRVWLFGAEVGSREWRRTRLLAAYVRQHAAASDFPINARETVEIGTAALRVGRREKKLAATEAMRLANCLHLARSPYAVLSGGEKQRVSIARCLAQRARLLVLDEPAAHLDARSKTDLMDILARCRREQGLTVVLISHEHHEAIAEEDGISGLSFEDGVVRRDGEVRL